MFILRTIDPIGIQQNDVLGESYTVTDRFTGYESFRRDFEDFYHRPHVADTDPESDFTSKNCFGFITFTTSNGDSIIPLFMQNYHFVMTDSGKTFTTMNQHHIIAEKVGE